MTPRRQAEFARSLSSCSSVALDTSSCLYYLTRSERRYSLMKEVMSRGVSGALTIQISGIVRLELLVRPYGSGDDEDMRVIRRFVQRTPGVAYQGISEDVIDASAALRARIALKVPDALVAGSAAVAGCDALIGNDAIFNRLNDLGKISIMGGGMVVTLPRYFHLDDYA